VAVAVAVAGEPELVELGEGRGFGGSGGGLSTQGSFAMTAGGWEEDRRLGQAMNSGVKLGEKLSAALKAAKISSELQKTIATLVQEEVGKQCNKAAPSPVVKPGTKGSAATGANGWLYTAPLFRSPVQRAGFMGTWKTTIKMLKLATVMMCPKFPDEYPKDWKSKCGMNSHVVTKKFFKPGHVKLGDSAPGGYGTKKSHHHRRKTWAPKWASKIKSSVAKVTKKLPNMSKIKAGGAKLMQKLHNNPMLKKMRAKATNGTRKIVQKILRKLTCMGGDKPGNAKCVMPPATWNCFCGDILEQMAPTGKYFCPIVQKSTVDHKTTDPGPYKFKVVLANGDLSLTENCNTVLAKKKHSVECEWDASIDFSICYDKPKYSWDLDRKQVQCRPNKQSCDGGSMVRKSIALHLKKGGKSCKRAHVILDGVLRGYTGFVAAVQLQIQTQKCN
jgi:hypothetical protein